MRVRPSTEEARDTLNTRVSLMARVTCAPPRSPFGCPPRSPCQFRRAGTTKPSSQAPVGVLGSEAKQRGLSAMLLYVTITFRRGGGGGVESIGLVARSAMRSSSIHLPRRPCCFNVRCSMKQVFVSPRRKDRLPHDPRSGVSNPITNGRWPRQQQPGVVLVRQVQMLLQRAHSIQA